MRVQPIIGALIAAFLFELVCRTFLMQNAAAMYGLLSTMIGIGISSATIGHVFFLLDRNENEALIGVCDIVSIASLSAFLIRILSDMGSRFLNITLHPVFDSLVFWEFYLCLFTVLLLTVLRVLQPVTSEKMQKSILALRLFSLLILAVLACIDIALIVGSLKPFSIGIIAKYVLHVSTNFAAGTILVFCLTVVLKGTTAEAKRRQLRKISSLFRHIFWLSLLAAIFSMVVLGGSTSGTPIPANDSNSLPNGMLLLSYPIGIIAFVTAYAGARKDNNVLIILSTIGMFYCLLSWKGLFHAFAA